MRTTTYQHTRKILGEWQRRAKSRRELAMLSGAERQDLGYRFEINAEMSKPFWQA